MSSTTRDASGAHLRLGILGTVLLSLFLALFSRLWYLQVMDSTNFKNAAQANQVRVITEPAPRGRILDRNGRVIVDNQVSRTVTVSREEVKRYPEVLGRLAALLNVSEA